MIGLAQSVTTPIFRSEKNVIAVVSRKVVIPKEETTEEGETNRQEMTGEVGMIASQENSEKPRGKSPNHAHNRGPKPLDARSRRRNRDD